VLGATPQEFESPILRRVDLQGFEFDATDEVRRVVTLVSILVSVASLWRVHRQRQQPLLCLVRSTADGAEQSATRRAGERPLAHCGTCTSGRSPIVGGKPRPPELPSELSISVKRRPPFRGAPTALICIARLVGDSAQALSAELADRGVHAARQQHPVMPKVGSLA
jgi:hypothetical protein